MLADAVFADANFDETEIVTDAYTAAFGSSPYAAMGSKDGFTIDLEHEMKKIYDDARGLVDIHLTGLSASAEFAPNSLTEAQYDTLLGLQDTAVVRPGQSYAKGGTDLVIAGSGNNGLTLTATISRAGPKAGKYAYKSGEHRLGPVQFTGKRRWSTGTAVEPFTLAIT